MLVLAAPALLGCGTECAPTLTCEGFPVPSWVDAAGSPGADAGADVVFDSAGNAIVVGSFESPSITFGSVDGAGNMVELLHSGQGASLYVIKYSPEGDALWAVTAESTGIAQASAVAVDADGSIFIAGHFEGASLTFQGLSALPVEARTEVFVAKLSPDGDSEWSLSSLGAAGELGPARVTDLDVRGTSVFVSGTFEGSTQLMDKPLLSAGGTDGFAVELSANNDEEGNVDLVVEAVWTVGQEGEDAVMGVAPHSQGVALCGYFDSATLPIDEDMPLMRTTGSEWPDLWAASLSTLRPVEQEEGEEEESPVQWSFAAEGSGDDRCLDIDTMAAGEGNASGADDLVITGYHTADIALGGTSLDDDNGGDFEELLVARLSGTAGAVQWLRSGLGSGASRGSAVSAHSSGGVAVAARYSGGGFQLGELELPATTTQRALLIKLDSDDGASRWLIPSTGGDQAEALGIANTAGRVLATGAFSTSELSFCPQDASGQKTLCDLAALPNMGDNDMFSVVIAD